jgi:hypothetical protein
VSADCASIDVRIKPFSLPREVKEDLTTELLALVADKLEADPDYASVQPELLKSIIDKDLVDEAFKRVEATPRGSKRRRLPFSDDDRVAKRTSHSGIYIRDGPTRNNSQFDANNFPLLTPETLQIHRSVDLNDTVPENRWTDQVPQINFSKIASTDQPPIAPETPSQTFSLSTHADFLSQSSSQRHQFSENDILSTPSQYISSAQSGEDQYNNVSTDFQSDSFSSVQQASWDSGFQSSLDDWDFDSQPLLILEHADPTSYVDQGDVTEAMTELTQEWGIVPQPSTPSPPSPSPAGRCQEKPSDPI